MQIYFTVQPRGAVYRVLDHEGYAFGPVFSQRQSAESYAEALNKARNRRPTTLPLPSPLLPYPQLTATPAPLGLTARLRQLAAKIWSTV